MKIFILLIPVTFSFMTMGCKQNQNHGKDEEAIRNIILQMTEAFNQHDAKKATQMYTSNADFVNVRGDKYTGAEEIQQKLAAIFLTRAKQATLKTLNELSGLVDSAGLKLPSHRELSIRIFIKENDNWRVTAFHNTMIRPF
jgi:hypothetical protein